MRDIVDYTTRYIEPGFEDYQIKYRRKKVMEILRQNKPRRILEIGCGMEPLFVFADWEYQLWTTVEPSDLFYNNALQKTAELGERGGQIRVFHEAFPTDIIKTMQFDFIVCSSLLHEVEDSEQFLWEMAGICSEDTIVHINVPNANSFHRILARGMKLVEDVHALSERNIFFQQHKVFDIKLLEKEVKNTGFAVLDCGGYFVKPFTHEQMYRMIENGIIAEKELDGLYEISKEFGDYGSEIYINAKLAFQKEV